MFLSENSPLYMFLQVVFLGEEGVDAGGVRKVKKCLSLYTCPGNNLASMFSLQFHIPRFLITVVC